MASQKEKVAIAKWQGLEQLLQDRPKAVIIRFFTSPNDQAVLHFCKEIFRF